VLVLQKLDKKNIIHNLKSNSVELCTEKPICMWLRVAVQVGDTIIPVPSGPVTNWLLTINGWTFPLAISEKCAWVQVRYLHSCQLELLIVTTQSCSVWFEFHAYVQLQCFFVLLHVLQVVPTRIDQNLILLHRSTPQLSVGCNASCKVLGRKLNTSVGFTCALARAHMYILLISQYAHAQPRESPRTMN
jgi:hypothetical protein